MKRVIFVGYMGAGKTTIGKALSDQLKMTFFDLDWYIEDRFHRKITEIFAEKGESGFREIERNMLHEVAEFENVIISSGGGTPCFFDNMEYMNQQAMTVYLKASPEVLCHHLEYGKSKRPLLKDKTEEEMLSFITESLKVREPFYNKAKHIFNVDPLDTIADIKLSVGKIVDLLGL